LRARAQRHNNLALLQQYGSNAWRVHNYLLEADTKKAESLLEELKEQTTSLNRERKNSQVNRLGGQFDVSDAKRFVDKSRGPVNVIGESVDRAYL
jgi:Breast carcinoma amplified sequence 2 (BCAS2)